MKRNNSFDSLKYLAMMEVIFIHFMYFFDEDLLGYIRNTIPYALIFKGLSAKVGLAVLAVISGYFSCRNKKNKSFVLYTVKKYLYFFLYCFAGSLLYCLINHDHQFSFSLSNLLIKSLFFEEDYYYYLWFVKSFFIGNIVSFLIGKLNIPIYAVVAFFFVLILTGEQYVAAFLIGCVLSALMDQEPPILNNKYLHLAFVFLILILPKIETEYAYSLYGICGAFLVILSQKNKPFHGFLENRFLSFFGRITMPILIVHYGCMYIFEGMGTKPLLLTYVMWMLITHISAYLISIPLDYLNKSINDLVDGIYRSIMLRIKTDE